MTTKFDFFEDIAASIESWTATATKATTCPGTDLVWVESPAPYLKLQSALEAQGVDGETVRQVFSECLRGFAVSVLTAIDGGTASAEKGRLYLVDEMGTRIGEGLHNDFLSYLIDSDRL